MKTMSFAARFEAVKEPMPLFDSEPKAEAGEEIASALTAKSIPEISPTAILEFTRTRNPLVSDREWGPHPRQVENLQH